MRLLCGEPGRAGVRAVCFFRGATGESLATAYDQGGAVLLPIDRIGASDFRCSPRQVAGLLARHSHGRAYLGRFAYILWRALANRVWRALCGTAYYRLTGEQKKTLAAELNLWPDEWVEVKGAAEIELHPRRERTESRAGV